MREVMSSLIIFVLAVAMLLITARTRAPRRDAA